MKTVNQKWLYLFILSLIWGSSFILIKKSLLGLSSYQLGALRNIMTGLFLFAVGFKSLKTIHNRDWKWLAISGFLGSFFPSFLFAIAETEIDSAVASILNSLTPLNTILFGVTVFKIANTKRQLLGVMIGFVGTALLIFKGADLNPDKNYLYAIFVLLATVCYAINVNIIKRYLQHVKPLTIAAGNYAVIFIPAVFVLCFSGFFSEATFSHPEFMASMIYLTILSFFGTALAKVLFNKVVHMTTPVFASSVTYLITIVALFWGVLDGEAFSLLQAIASIIILFGVYLSQKKHYKTPKS